MANKIYIFLGVYARAGKDTLAYLLIERFRQIGMTAAKFSLAAPLKSCCKHFLEDNFNYDVFTEDTQEKSKFRDFLVCVGKMFRESTKGQFFTNILEKKVENSDIQICIVPDLRYADPRWPDTDELAFAKRKNGYIVFIDRTLEDGSLIGPANVDEEKYGGIIKENANCCISWDSETKEPVADIVFEQIVKHFNIKYAPN